MDFRMVNYCCKALPYLRSNRHFSFAATRPFKIGSKLDISQAFFQVKLADQISKRMGFQVGNRFFRLLRLPMGFVNSSHFFMRALQTVLYAARQKTSSRLHGYMDDWLLLSNSEEEHCKDLHVLLKLLQEDGWTLNRTKCIFGATKFKFLDQVLTTEGWRLPASMIQSIRAMQAPSTKKDWQKFRGWLLQCIPYMVKGSNMHKLLQMMHKDPERGWQKFQEFFLATWYIWAYRTLQMSIPPL